MGFGKWIGGIVGFMAAGPLGALAGYAIGSMFEGKEEDTYSGGGYGGSYTGRTYQDPAYGQRNSFLFSLLVMASYIIKADGNVKPITLKMGELTDDERTIILCGCLINYYKAGN